VKKTYKIIFEKKAAKFFISQPSQQKKRLARAIYRLPDGDVKTIKGYKNFYRLRVGDYRVIFTINDSDLIIIVLTIGNRGDIYKKL